MLFQMGNDFYNYFDIRKLHHNYLNALSLSECRKIFLSILRILRSFSACVEVREGERVEVYPVGSAWDRDCVGEM